MNSGIPEESAEIGDGSSESKNGDGAELAPSEGAMEEKDDCDKLEESNPSNTQPEPMQPLLLEFVYVSVLLDGRTSVGSSNMSKLSLCSTIALPTEPLAVPKGGALAGTPVVIPISRGLVDSSMSFVRLRGIASSDPSSSTESAIVKVPATVTLTAAAEEDAEGDTKADAATVYVDAGGRSGEVGFILPDLATIGVEPELKGKDKFLFFDVSLDGGESWECSNDSLLQIK